VKLFGEKSGGQDESAAGGQPQQAVRELLDRYHHRASISDGERLMLDPSQVLENIALAMERVDNDINTPISIEEDVASLSELAGLIQGMMMGPLLAVHVVNTALKIMSARYPTELVDNPLPPEYDLRKLFPLQLDDREHEVAKAIFNRRTTAGADLDAADVTDELEALGVAGQLQVLVCLIYMYGTKVGAMKHRTGIE
jgi:hypothetical protein